MRIPPVPEEKALATGLRAFECGINHFETAKGYGTSEVLFGKIVKLLPREKIVLTTKAVPGPGGADGMRKDIDQSLALMGVSFIDNFDLHGINTEVLFGHAFRRGGAL